MKADAAVLPTSSALWQQWRSTPSSSGCFDRRVDQIADDLVAVRRNADRLPQADKLADHPGTGVRLSCAGRALDWQNAAVQVAAQPDRRL